MNITSFLEKLNKNPESISFTETIAVIEENYTFEPTAFENGVLHNTAEENTDSCHSLSSAEHLTHKLP